MMPPLPSPSTGRVFREPLATARTLVVNTRKYDIHRRYVAHVFYAFNRRGIERTFLKDRYLNQELVDKGFAKVVWLPLFSASFSHATHAS
jgi:hypothetical protein